jgi:hypothetical protein
MIREPRNNFDEHIKEALQGFEMPFEPDDWALMEQKLNTEAGQTGLVLFFSNKYLQVGIAAALLLCVLYHTNTWLANPNVDLAQHTQTTSQNASAAPNQATKTQDLSEQITAIADENDIANNDISNTAKAATNFSLVEEKAIANTHSSKSNKQSAALFDISPSKKATTNNNISAYDKKNTLHTTNEEFLLEKTEAIEDYAAATFSRTTNQPNFQTANIQASTLKNNSFDTNANASTAYTSIENAIAISSNENILKKNTHQANDLQTKSIEKNILPPLATKNAALVKGNDMLAATIETAQPLTDFSTVIKAPKVPKKKAEIAIGSYSSLDINFLEAHFPEAGLTTGLGLQFGKNKRWGFQTGAFYTYKNYPTYNFVEETAVLSDMNFLETADGDMAGYNYNVSSSRAVTIEERFDLFSIRAFFLEIPLLVTHNFKPKASINPYLAAGMSFWLPTSLQKTNYKSQTIATYDYVTALQSLNDRNNAEEIINVRNPEFIINTTSSIGIDSTNTGDDLVENVEANYINVIPDYHTAISEEAVNQTIVKSRAYWDILQLQAGLDVKLSKRMSFQLAGQLKGSLFKHALNRDAIQHLPNVDKRLHTIGIQMGLTCTL